MVRPVLHIAGMKRRLYLIAMSAALVLPATTVVAQEHHDNRKYEDRAHKDTHEWNNDEDQRYRRYLEEHHKKYHQFSKASKREQNDYWNWRHRQPER
jgi:hypothetical protein